MNKLSAIALTLTLTLAASLVAHGSRFYECASLQPASCTKELTKGQAVVRKAQDSSVIIIKVDEVFLDQESGAIKVVKSTVVRTRKNAE